MISQQKQAEQAFGSVKYSVFLFRELFYGTHASSSPKKGVVCNARFYWTKSPLYFKKQRAQHGCQIGTLFTVLGYASNVMRSLIIYLYICKQPCLLLLSTNMTCIRRSQPTKLGADNLAWPSPMMDVQAILQQEGCIPQFSPITRDRSRQPCKATE